MGIYSNVAPSTSSEHWTLKARGSRRREAWGSWEGVSPSTPSPADYGIWGRHELPQRGPGRSPGRQRILGIFQGLRILLVETMHNGTNQKFGGAWARFGGPVPPWPQPKTATGYNLLNSWPCRLSGASSGCWRLIVCAQSSVKKVLANASTDTYRMLLKLTWRGYFCLSYNW